LQNFNERLVDLPEDLLCSLFDIGRSNEFLKGCTYVLAVFFHAFLDLELWRFFTYACVHENLLQLAINAVSLAAFGTALALTAGTRRTIVYGLAGCLAGGMAAGMGAFLLPQRPVMGGTALVCGVAAVYVIRHGGETLFYARSVPVPTGALAVLLMIGSLAASVAGGQWFNLLQVLGGGGGIACHYLAPTLASWVLRRRVLRRERELQQDQEVVERVDSLLIKVQEAGLRSLTRREQAFLKRASRRYRQRILEPLIDPAEEKQEPIS